MARKYTTLHDEMGKRNITGVEIAKFLNYKRARTVTDRISGHSGEFSVDEMYKIHQEFFKDTNLIELFDLDMDWMSQFAHKFAQDLKLAKFVLAHARECERTKTFVTTKNIKVSDDTKHSGLIADLPFETRREISKAAQANRMTFAQLIEEMWNDHGKDYR